MYLFGVLAIAMLLVLSGCGNGDTETEPEPAPVVEPEPTPEPTPVVPAGATVELDKFDVTNGEVTVQAGATVTWKNMGDTAHLIQVNGADKRQVAKSETLENGGEFAFTFENAGEYTWVSAPFPGLVRGTVTVE